MTDLYSELGVDRSASVADVRKAYRRAAKKAHPDGGGSAEAFAAVSTALEVLSDPARRDHYDATGKIDEKPADNAQAETMNAVAASFGRVMAQMQAGMRVTNFIQCMKNDLGQFKGKCAVEKRRLEGEIAQQEKFAKRFRRKGQGQNWLVEFALAAVAGHREGIAKCQHEIEVVDRALLFLDDYEDIEALGAAGGLGLTESMVAQMAGGRMW